MQNSFLDFRNKALYKIKKGKEEFSQKQTEQEKQQAKDLFTSGVQDLLDVLKYESNPEIVNALKTKVQEYIQDAKDMKAKLDQMGGKSKVQEPHQQNGNSNQNFNQPNQPQNFNNIPKQPSNNQQKHDDDDKNQGEENKEQKKFEDSLTQAIVTEKPNVKWEDVAGLEQAKKALQEAVILPTRFPEIFDDIRRPWKGILLYGPPGTGKTFLAKACATECNATFFSISSSDLVSKYVGESAKLIRTLFQMARKQKPSIIFIDEIDSLAGSRDGSSNDASKSVVTEFLVQMQGVGKDDKGVLVLAATNIPWGLDAAIRRRFEKRIYIQLPEQPARRSLLFNSLKKTQTSLTEQQIDELANQTNGYSGADLTNLIKDAAYAPLRRAQDTHFFRQVKSGDKIQFEPLEKEEPGSVQKDFFSLTNEELYLPPISFEDFKKALKNVKKSVSEKDLGQQIQFTKDFGQEG